MRALRDTVIFVLCGLALLVWGLITLLSPGAPEGITLAEAASRYWTIPVGAAMLGTGIVFYVRGGRRRATPSAGSQGPGEPGRGGASSGPADGPAPAQAPEEHRRED
ncbi:hypothetical protein ACFPZ0_08170 [Streptomonospora nanhaiensis]|uniref:Uncharacterized protein n=1 Tax=Streptomonospora nanhaiensis TaxID=1323731 RepID=A0A853BGW6_9ACTN|nr:hypothetical protein [Streptomonospora nanhaiensis]MBV2366593.1 hypothetical protein [Streptomonospora nanhaiensis]NYI93852.1 hypothetical protein [Streptomonospora nanhaiensis]